MLRRSALALAAALGACANPCARSAVPTRSQRKQAVCIRARGLREALLAAAAELAGRRVRCPSAEIVTWNGTLRVRGRAIEALPLGRWQAFFLRLSPRRPLERQAAWLAALEWLARRIPSADPGELSDLLQAFCLLSQAASTDGLRRLGRVLAVRAANAYFASAPDLRPGKTPVESLFDAVSVLVSVRLLPTVKIPDAFARRVRLAWHETAPSDLLRSDEGPWEDNPARLLDLLVDFYFPHALGLPLPVSYSRILERALRYPYGSQGITDADTYLATHLVYVLTDFGLRRGPDLLPSRVVSYLVRAEAWYRQRKDVETLGEICECLDILKRPRNQCIALLLATQRPSGAWTDPDEEGYRAYHTTWAALFGILEFRRRAPRSPFHGGSVGPP